MVALKGAAIDAFVADPNPAQPVVLAFGPDAGLVSERVQTILRASIEDPADPFQLVRLEGDELSADPGRLIDEARTMPLFGGRRAVWVKAGPKDLADAVEAVIATSLGDCRIVIEAGDLRRGSTLRTLCERAQNAVAIACYPDDDPKLARLIDAELRAAGLSITPEARAALTPLLGGDRRASLSEIRKLALYARGGSRVELDDVLAIVSDASALTLEHLLDAAFAGRTAEVEREFDRARSAGIPSSRIITAALYHVGQLHRARIAVEAGASVAAAAERILSKAQFRRKQAVETALRNWVASKLERVMAQLAEASLTTRQLTGAGASLADPVVGRALLNVARAARVG